MGAIWMLVRTAWRRHRRASVYLAVVAGLAAGVIGASFQAAHRAGSSVDRFSERSRIYDEIVQGCPPGVNPDQITSLEQALERCLNPKTTEQFRSVVNRVPGVERTSTGSILVVALLDKTATNHWGRLALLDAAGTPGSPPSHGRPIVVEGRIIDPAAPDEIMVGEEAARGAGLHVGDVVHMAGWHQADLDAAVDGSVAPQTPSSTSKVVGIVRYFEDVQPDEGGNLSDSVLPGEVYAGPAWLAAHRAGIAGYGSGVLVRLRGGAKAIPAFDAAMNKSPAGWFALPPTSVTDVSVGSLGRVIQLERNAVLIFATIAIVASTAFVGLTAMRQLRRESENAAELAALGMTRRDRRLVNVVRALTIALPAFVVAAAVIVALSPVGPIGFARKLEFDIAVRLDPTILALTLLGLVGLFALVGLVAPIGARARRRSRAGRRGSRLDPALLEMGAVPLVGAKVARGRSSGAAIGVTAVALAAALAAGVMVASYDRLISRPARYGAWWDVAVGQYSERAPLAVGVAKVRANPAVVAAAGYDDDTDSATIDGHHARLLASVNYVGHERPVMAEGRTPAADDEIALGESTANTLHKGVGDEVTVVSDAARVRAHVVGIVVINDPITSQSGAGEGAYLTQPLMLKIVGHGLVPQSIVIKVDPHLDRATAIESVRRDFSGSIREATPQVDLRNLGHMRSVPWLISALVALLALATLIHALVLMLTRNRKNLAVLAALGFTRGQRRGVGIFASTALVFVGTLIAVPVGLIVGTRIWRGVTQHVGLPTQSAVPWSTLVVAPISALAIAALVSLFTSRGAARMAPSEQLRVE